MRSIDVVVNSVKNVPKGVLHAAKAVTGISIYEAYNKNKTIETPTGHASDGKGLGSIIGIMALYTGHTLVTLSAAFNVDMSIHVIPVGELVAIYSYVLGVSITAGAIIDLNTSPEPIQLSLEDGLHYQSD